MNNAICLIKEFVEEKLQGNLQELAHYDFAQLRGDQKYGACNSTRFDCDNTKLSQAIYLLVFEDVWSQMNATTLEQGLYRGDTINSFNTTFGKPTTTGGFAGLNRFAPNDQIQQRVLKFHASYHTIGNFIVLPNLRVGRHTLNTFRGSYHPWRDYIDKFIGALHLQLTTQQGFNNKLFQQLIAVHTQDFEPYLHQAGFETLMGKLLLDDCINQAGKPKQLFRVIYHWDKRLTRDIYLEHINQYLDFSEHFIEKRSAKMVKILASKIR